MDRNDKTDKKTEIENTKKEIIKLRIKNNYYNQSSIIDKVIDEILFEEFEAKDSRNNKAHLN